jgi:beta-phosphoglucomutase-like phosphatase (HAD superfamily)
MQTFDAILFDCDGVLVDSEPITNAVLQVMLSELGWQMTARECFATFVGHAVIDQAPLIKVGLLDYFAGRTFSGMEQPRNKPHPDVYLAAAKALGVPIHRCAVVEDTPNGASAGVAAGATVFGYVPLGGLSDNTAAMQAVGVQRFFADMMDLPDLLAAAA